MSEPPHEVVVIDSSALVALLVDAGSAGEWVSSTVTGATLAAPALVLFETSNILRRHQLAGVLDATQASLAHQDLLALPMDLWPYMPLAERVWELRRNVTSYDGSYVALAELLEAPLVTLDARLANAPGPRCEILHVRG